MILLEFNLYIHTRGLNTTEPLPSLLSSDNCDINAVKEPSSDGIDPVKSVFSSDNQFKDDREPSSNGKVPH